MTEFSFFGFSGLFKLIHLYLVEFKLSRFFLSEIGKVESDTHEVALSCIVAFIKIVVNNDVVTIVFGCRNVLEVIQIQWVSQDVVRVNTLQSPALCFS